MVSICWLPMDCPLLAVCQCWFIIFTDILCIWRLHIQLTTLWLIAQQCHQSVTTQDPHGRLPDQAAKSCCWNVTLILYLNCVYWYRKCILLTKTKGEHKAAICWWQDKTPGKSGPINSSTTWYSSLDWLGNHVSELMSIDNKFTW